jgi:regulatory protein
MEETNSELAKAKATVFRLFKFRPRSEREIVEKLKTKKIAAENIDAAIEYFRKLDYIDDRRFAKAWTSSRLVKTGINRIRFELKKKGIAEDIIQETIGQIPEDYSELEAILPVAQKRLRKYKGLDPIKTKRRLFEFLARRGFRQSTVQKALRQLFKEKYDE